MFRLLTRHAQIWWSVASDKRSPAMTKILPIAALLYVLLPIDVVPDFLPLLGQLDDIGIIVLLVSIALKVIPHDLWQEHDKKINQSNVIDV